MIRKIRIRAYPHSLNSLILPTPMAEFYLPYLSYILHLPYLSIGCDLPEISHHRSIIIGSTNTIAVPEYIIRVIYLIYSDIFYLFYLFYPFYLFYLFYLCIDTWIEKIRIHNFHKYYLLAPQHPIGCLWCCSVPRERMGGEGGGV